MAEIYVKQEQDSSMESVTDLEYDMLYKVDSNKDDRWCNCLALHDFSGDNVKWQEWFDFALSIFSKHQLAPTRLAVNGTYYGNSAKSLTFKGGLRKLQKYDFKGIECLGFMAMPSKEDYTTNFIIKVFLYPNWQKPKNSTLTMCFDEKLEMFNQESFEKMTSKLHKFTNAKYGYYYYRHLRNSPDMYPSGSCDPYINKADKDACRLWDKQYSYNNGSYRTGNIRDVYRLNFLSKEHLEWQISGNQNLEEWIKSSPNHGKLTEISPGFWSWYVEEHLITPIRQALIPSNIIICV